MTIHSDIARRILSATLRRLPALYCKKTADACPSHLSPVFIVGAPRSGSTALYQAITASLDVSYISNLDCHLHYSLPIAFRVSKFLYGARAHRCFSSRFGDTRECGCNAPSECGEFWYRWLPRDRHFIGWDDIKLRWIREIRSEIVAASKIDEKRIVFKNLNAGQRLRLISQIAPDARVIHITRDIRFNVQSILNARRNNGVPVAQWWSIKPPNFERYLSLPEVELCVAQVKALEAQICVDRKLFPAGRWMDVDYEEFTADPDATIQHIAEFLGVSERSTSRRNEMVSAVGAVNCKDVRVSLDKWEEICRAAEDLAIDQLVEKYTVHG